MSQILIISDSHYLRKNELHQLLKLDSQNQKKLLDSTPPVEIEVAPKADSNHLKTAEMYNSH